MFLVILLMTASIASFAQNDSIKSLKKKSKDRKIIESKVEIKESELPSHIQVTLKKNYLDHDYKTLCLMRKDMKGVVLYEIEVMKEGLYYIVQYDDNGITTNLYALDKRSILNNPNSEGGF